MTGCAVAVAAETRAEQSAALKLGSRLDLPVQDLDHPTAEILLVVTAQRLELRQSGPGAPGPVFVDFVTGKAAHRRKYGGGRGIHLARAAGLKQGKTPSVLDATAGLGQDAFVLASLGCEVTLVEQSPVIAALLEDGLLRATQDTELADIVRRMHLVQADSREHLEALTPDQYPDTIYLDPMYPHKGKAALAKKEMQLFQRLLGKDQNGAELLLTARQAAMKRTVVKRPLKAPWLGNLKPDADIRSRNTRYDIYFPHKSSGI